MIVLIHSFALLPSQYLKFGQAWGSGIFTEVIKNCPVVQPCILQNQCTNHGLCEGVCQTLNAEGCGECSRIMERYLLGTGCIATRNLFFSQWEIRHDSTANAYHSTVVYLAGRLSCLRSFSLVLFEYVHL